MTLWLIVELYLNFVVCLIEKYIESNSLCFQVVLIFTGSLASRSQSFNLNLTVYCSLLSSLNLAVSIG